MATTNLFDRVIGVAGNTDNEDVQELVFTALSDLYLIQLDLSNVDTTGVQVSVEMSDGSKTINWVKGVQIPVGATISIIEGQKAVLMEGDTLTIRCDTANKTVNAFISFIKEINTFPTND